MSSPACGTFCHTCSCQRLVSFPLVVPYLTVHLVRLALSLQTYFLLVLRPHIVCNVENFCKTSCVKRDLIGVKGTLNVL